MNNIKAIGLGLLTVISSGCEEKITKHNEQKNLEFEQNKNEIICDTSSKSNNLIKNNCKTLKSPRSVLYVNKNCDSLEDDDFINRPVNYLTTEKQFEYPTVHFLNEQQKKDIAIKGIESIKVDSDVLILQYKNGKEAKKIKIESSKGKSLIHMLRLELNPKGFNQNYPIEYLD